VTAQFNEEDLRAEEQAKVERERRERLFWTYEAALIAIANGHERPVELAIKILTGAP